jgi:hypothetical protein
MDELINKLVTDYKADRITWHDIQDMVEGYVMKQDGKGMTLDINVIHTRVIKENKILEKIEKEIRA